MIDDVSLRELIEQQIQIAVKQKIDQLVDNREWLEQLETRTIEIVRNRIVGKFANISTVPDLVETVQQSVEKLFSQGQIPDLANYIDVKSLEIAIDNAIQDLVKHTIDSLVVDPTWIEKIESIVNSNMSTKLTRMMNQIDINQLLKEQIDIGIERWQERLKENFATKGIKDQSESTQLTVLDGVVVVENEMVSKHLTVDTDATINGSLIVNDLVLKGKINTDNHSWNELAGQIEQRVLASATETWRNELVTNVLTKSKETGIDFSSVTVGGELLVSGDRLSSKITDTNIRKLGTLDTLTVTGKTKLAETVTIKNKRIGINTDDPEMAVGLWDEEVAIILGKLAQDKAFVGTARAQELAIGTNRKTAISVDVDGLTTIKALRVDRFKISHGTEVPGYSGTRGDFVFNSDPKPNSPFAWVCLGGFKWQPLRSA